MVSADSQIGRAADAQRELDRLGDDGFAGLETGTEWHFSASLLAETVAAPGAARHAPGLYLGRCARTARTT